MSEYRKAIIWALVISSLVIIFIAQAFYIPSVSMSPTLLIKDRIIVNKFIYSFTEPQRQEIIVFKYPVQPRRKLIKRLIGLAGDKVEIKDGLVYLNDQLLEEDYILEKDYRNYGPVVIPEDNYFVLGDNRNNSEDSRFWGFVPQKNIIGKAILIFWPLNRIKIL